MKELAGRGRSTDVGGVEFDEVGQLVDFGALGLELA